VAFHTLGTTYVFNGNTIHFAGLDVVMKLLVNAVELVTGAVAAIVKVHLALTVTVHTPAHAQLCSLVHYIHFLDITMTGLASYFTGIDVLCVVKVNMVREVVNFTHSIGFALEGSQGLPGSKPAY
jgi:hypothetical protein